MVRSSNLELLRVVSMLYILLYHFFLSLEKAEISEFLVKSSQFFFHIGVICFLLISGYFGIKASLKGFIKLFIQCTFYSIGIYILIPGFIEHKFVFTDFIKSFLALSHTNLWFVSSYACLYIFSPIINTALRYSSKRKKEAFILLLVIISAYFGLFSQQLDLNNGKNVVNFVLIYCLGNYAYHYLPPAWAKKKRAQLISAYLIINTLVIVSLSFGNALSGAVFYLSFPYNSPILQLNAFVFFLVFVSFDKFKSKVVNWLAASMFTVYLIHESRFVGHYIYEFVNSVAESFSGAYFIIYIFVVAFVVCSVSVIVDKLCQPVIAFIERIIFKIPGFNKMDEKFKIILENNQIPN